MKAAFLETFGDAVLVAVGLGYLSRQAKHQQGAGGAQPAASGKSPFDVGIIGSLTLNDEVNYGMVVGRWWSGLDADGIKEVQEMMDEIGTFGIGQRRAIKTRIAKEYSNIVEETRKSKSSRTLTPAEITKLTNEIKASIPAGTTIDQTKLDAAINALKMELTETPIEAIDEALDKVINEFMAPMLRWKEAGKLKENLIAMDYMHEFDFEQTIRDGVKGAKNKIEAQHEGWRAVYGDATGQKPLSPEAQAVQKKLEGEKAGADAEDILRPIGREIKSLDFSEYDMLNKKIERIRAITDTTARLQEAQQFKTNYEASHKTDAALAKEQMRQEYGERKRNAGWNPFRRR